MKDFNKIREKVKALAPPGYRVNFAPDICTDGYRLQLTHLESEEWSQVLLAGFYFDEPGWDLMAMFKEEVADLQEEVRGQMSPREHDLDEVTLEAARKAGEMPPKVVTGDPSEDLQRFCAQYLGPRYYVEVYNCRGDFEVVVNLGSDIGTKRNFLVSGGRMLAEISPEGLHYELDRVRVTLDNLAAHPEALKKAGEMPQTVNSLQDLANTITPPRYKAHVQLRAIGGYGSRESYRVSVSCGSRARGEDITFDRSTCSAQEISRFLESTIEDLVEELRKTESSEDRFSGKLSPPKGLAAWLPDPAPADGEMIGQPLMQDAIIAAANELKKSYDARMASLMPPRQEMGAPSIMRPSDWVEPDTSWLCPRCNGKIQGVKCEECGYPGLKAIAGSCRHAELYQIKWGPEAGQIGCLEPGCKARFETKGAGPRPGGKLTRGPEAVVCMQPGWFFFSSVGEDGVFTYAATPLNDDAMPPPEGYGFRGLTGPERCL